jgi:hypothetical protein
MRPKSHVTFSAIVSFFPGPGAYSFGLFIHFFFHFMTHKTYFQNFFVPLCASLSDDEFLAFADTVLANLRRDAATNAADLAFLAPLVERLREAHVARGPLGKAATTTTLGQAVKNFLAWVKLTNTTKVFPAFPDRAQAERVDIFPGGMDALYHASQANILERAEYYVKRVSGKYAAQTQVAPTEAQAQYQLLEDALLKRRTDVTGQREGAAAVDAEELAVCGGLYRVYAGLLHAHSDNPALAYASFPFPQTTGAADDDNLPSLPPAPHPAG